MKTGIHTGLPMAQYLAIEALSSGLCNTLLQCSPFHAKWQQTHPGEASEVSDTGTAIHDVLLEGMDRIVQVAADDWRTKAAKEQRDLARLEGKIPMLSLKVPRVHAAVKAAQDYVAGSELKGIFDSGAPEQTVVWQEDGMLCKSRPDWTNDERGIILHVKTTGGSANPEVWIRTHLTPSGYDMAAAFYELGMRAATGKDYTSVFLVIEQDAPHGCSLVGLAPAMRDLASRKVERAIALWTDCHTKGRWPSYPSRIAYAEPKPWEMAQAEEQSIRAFTGEQLAGGIPL